MIDLESIAVEGFVSWGPYPSILKLSKMEQCFIVGNVYDKTGQSYGRSNGAGKSSLMQAVLWCLSGKTVYNQNPGDKVLNWFIDSNARVALKFKNGDELTRVRTRQGDTELLFRRGTQEIINCTLSTTSNQQRLLDKELKFDYGLFCGSVFFSQYRQPWLAMQDQARRQAFERIMGIDRLSIYAEVAKSKYDRVVQEQEKRKIKIDSLNTSIANSIQQLDLAQKSSSLFESTRDERRKAKIQRAAEYEEQARQFTLINVAALAKKWTIVAKIEAKIDELESQIDELESQITAIEPSMSAAENTKLQTIMRLKEEAQKSKNQVIKLIQAKKDAAQSAVNQHKKIKENEIKICDQKILDLRGQIASQNGIIDTQNAIIKKWRDKAGKICVECERELPVDYANSKINGPQAIKAAAESKAKKLANMVDVVNGEITKIREQIDALELDATNNLKELNKESDTLTSAIDIQLERSTAAAKDLETSVKAELNATKIELQDKKTKLEQLVKTTKAKLDSIKPETTVNEANATNAQRDTILDSARKAKEDADSISAEKNTHAESIINLGCNIKQQEDQVKIEQKDLTTYDIILVHLQYIQKAYSDRRKIKSYLISRHQPYFNSRLHHYLDLFGLDIKVSLTDSLGIDSNLWGYDFQSGGERGRTDLAFMFAVFDLHQGIHGPQCNILVLDEPEKALDEAGRQMLISVIKDDLATRFESIFIISHSDCFHDVFPHQITVERTDRFSHITDIR
jgi:DNA repair exonuclease SbcCD ATPase subunit